jgi:tetratricopeptide (TPR) repeat protein
MQGLKSPDSRERILSSIGILVEDIRLIPRERRTYYINITQLLRKIEEDYTHKEKVDRYIDILKYLCQTKDFVPIQNILHIPIELTEINPNIKTTLVNYLLDYGFSVKLYVICRMILDSFQNENIDLLKIEFYLVTAKSASLDRISRCQLLEDFRKKVSNNFLISINVLNSLAFKQFDIGNYTEASKNFKTILNRIEQQEKSNNISVPQNNENYVNIQKIKSDVLEGLARIEMIIYKFKNALELYNQVILIRQKYNFLYELLSPLVHQGVIYKKLKEYDSAIDYLIKAKEIAIKINNKGSIEWVNHHLAYVLMLQKKYDIAEELARECLEQAVLEERDNEMGDFYEQMGLIKLAKKNNLEAINYFELSLFARQRVENKHGEASSLNHLSVSLFRAGNYIKSFIRVKKAMIIFYNLKILNLKRLYRIISLFWEC